MQTILFYIRPYIFRISLNLVIKFLGTIMDLFLPWILAYIVDTVVHQNNVSLIIFWGGVMILCAFFGVAANVGANRMASGVARDSARTLRHDLFTKISGLSCVQIDKISVPSLIARLSSDTYNIHRMVSSMQRIGIRAPILMLGGIIMTLSLDSFLTLVLIAIMPFAFIVIYIVSSKGIPLYTKLQEAIDAMIRVVRENATGIRIIKALSKTEYEKKRFAGANKDVTDREWKAAIIMGITNPAMSIFLNLGLVVVIIAGAYRVNSGLTQPGVIIAFLSYFTIILQAMLSITRMFVMLSRGTASGDRIGEVLALPEDIKITERDHEDSLFHISFNNVGFSYDPVPGREPVLEGISFNLGKGETLGILGETGCGKSTIIQLLLRFYDPQSGVIRINGDDIKGIPPEELYVKFGIVFQKDVLFADTISENISFGRELDAEDLQRAVRYAQADEFVSSLEEGLGYSLSSRGTNISGGQRQRLLIARAFASKTGAPPEILILDDSSSALDYRTDAKLRKGLREEFGKSTKIIIAQRVSSIMSADHILVLEKGRVTGFGNHDELLESCQLYQEIYQSQMGRRLAHAG